MNDLVTDVKSLELETLKNLKSSKANNTLRAYKADFKDFALFCQQNGLNSMPSEPKIVTLYITHLSKSSKIVAHEKLFLRSFASICARQVIQNNLFVRFLLVALVAQRVLEVRERHRRVPVVPRLVHVLPDVVDLLEFLRASRVASLTPKGDGNARAEWAYARRGTSGRCRRDPRPAAVRRVNYNPFGYRCAATRCSSGQPSWRWRARSYQSAEKRNRSGPAAHRFCRSGSWPANRCCSGQEYRPPLLRRDHYRRPGI